MKERPFFLIAGVQLVCATVDAFAAGKNLNAAAYAVVALLGFVLFLSKE